MAAYRLCRPPKGQRCDFAVGTHLDHCGAPKIDRCPAEATVAGLLKQWVGTPEVWMCEACYEQRADLFARRTKRPR